jgi:flagellar protein FliO/FliZ
MLEMLLRIGFSLLVVLGLLWLLGRVMRRPLSGRAAGALSVLARQQVSRNATVALVRVVDRALILGVTEGQVTLLGEADLATVQVPSHGSPAEPAHRETVRVDRPGPLDGSVLSPRTWSHTMEFLRSRTARR